MPDLVKTRQQLIEKAAEDLGALEAGQSLAAEDAAKIENFVDPLVQDLAVRGIAMIDDTEQIPLQFFLPLALLVKNAAANAFGQAYSDAMQTAMEGRLVAANGSTGTRAVLKGEFV